ncbi:hypothetical protein GY45DRAFT_312381 [Cubamyces sp. BRFM 1775]|nr:hypothetical protein GY45DRAFT_312381 [Cubamyces sp. BRFM 1775]
MMRSRWLQIRRPNRQTDQTLREMLHFIFLVLYVADGLACQLACKSFTDVFETLCVQYKCELACTATVDGATQDGTPVTHRLRAIKKYQASLRASSLNLCPTLSGESNRNLRHMGPVLLRT